MKIGTITVHNGYNYGASLQAYALVRLLIEEGHDAQLIDYRTKKIECNVRKTYKRSLAQRAVRFVLNGKKGADLRKKRFDDFHQRIIKNDKNVYYDVEELKSINQRYDGFICGSDQIWNPAITDSDTAFFLAFAEKSKKRIAYAPSMGAGEIKDIEFFQSVLQNIESLSVREQHNAEEVSRITNRECAVVVDPVMLLEKQVWERMPDIAAPLKTKKPYVLYYTVHEDESLFEYAKTVAKHRGVVVMRTDILPLMAMARGCRSAFGQGIGPAEFVRLICDADYVVTNSFHGTVFSVLLQKPFCVKLLNGKLEGKNHRICDLLSVLNLQDRILLENEIKDTQIDWTHVESVLEQLRMQSINYLRNALEQE